MQKGHALEIECQSCRNPVRFSVFEIEKNDIVDCEQCKKRYLFSDPVLKRQLKKFELLCRQIYESEEILGSASVGVRVGSEEVLVPFKILLTRLNSKLNLKIGDQTLTVLFRIEPTKLT